MILDNIPTGPQFHVRLRPASVQDYVPYTKTDVR